MFCGLENLLHPLGLPSMQLTRNWKILADVSAESPSTLQIAFFFVTVFQPHFQSHDAQNCVNTLVYQSRASPVQMNLQRGHGVFPIQYSFHPSLLVDRPVRLSWRSAALETRKLHAEKDNWGLRIFPPLIKTLSRSVWKCWWGRWCWTPSAIAWEGGPWPVRGGGWQTGCSVLTNTNTCTF